MADESYSKQELLALIKQDGNNRCADCSNPNPQWASLSFGAWICLECSGVHRSFGVHRTFVRSATMDKWSEDQIRKMRLGGNRALNDFLASYGPGGGYETGMSIQQKYDTWAALQYKDKLAALSSSPPEPWSPSPAPPPTAQSGSAPNSRPASAQGVRKARGFGNTGGIGSSSLSQETDEVDSRRAANETFFSGLGDKNASRSTDLPPSQGGRYAGFGSTPEPAQTSSHPSFALSSHNAPSLDELRNDPMKAVGKGWGLFSAAVSMASRTVQSTLSDPALTDNIRSGLGTVATSASSYAASTNSLIKERAGVDLASKFSELGSAVGGHGEYGGYRTAPISQEGVHHGGAPVRYRDDSDGEGDDFHAVFGNNPSLNKNKSTSASASASSSSAPPKKADKWDDEFEDF